jgi:endonuclease YncB( thermonuclease family)
MGGWGPLMMAGLLAGSALAAAAEDTSSPLPGSACRLSLIGTGKVATILDGRDFALDDGREVRVAAVEVPTRGRPGAAAKAALERLLAGQTVELRQPAPAADRYGRILAQVFLAGEKEGRAVAHELLAQGNARVGTHVGSPACAAELLAREQSARAAKLGLWVDPYYVIRGAESGAELLGERGRFTVVQGKVLSVRESGGTIYMNFGRRWSDALTVTILKRHERIFTQAGLPLKSLQNRFVRVRGWVDERNGPRIEASYPEQIELPN